MPNSNVNDDGKPNLNNSNARNDNNARVAVKFRELSRLHSYANHQFDGVLQLIWLGFLVHLSHLLALIPELLLVLEPLIHLQHRHL